MAGALRLRIRLTPRGGRDRIDGWAEDADGARVLKVRVTAPPADGAANEALVRLLARTLGVPRSAVAITAGASSRRKTVEVVGDAAALALQLEAPETER
ncbi:MAG TPA: DUF167 domain-containing protein [Paracoccaceae bacterium]|nr:DUF167 domain-containing protein [Paracoccaceae bacterium]